MSETSHVLGLPYIQPAQAQKHVTHNEAIRVLDALVQLSVQNRDQTVPPSAPNPGDRHIVSVGASGDWSGQDGSIAVFEDAAWAFYEPQTGWQTVVHDEGIVLIWTGTDWTGPAIDSAAFQNIDSVGINTTSDTTNRLAVASDATLLSHAGSDHRVVVNKAAASDTASLLFQTGYSGRAEMGTAGSDDFAVKVSADSATWNTGVSFDAVTGRASFPSGVKAPCRVEVGGRIYCNTDNRWVTHSTSHGIKNQNISGNAGTDAEPTLTWTHLGAMVEQGCQMQSLLVGQRGNSSEVTGFDLRVYFQSGPWTTGFTSSAEVTRTLIAAQDGITASTGFHRFNLDLGDYEAPDDGFVLFFIRPVGTITTNRYLYSSMRLGYLSAD